ncbi:mitochondrial fission ELM1 family protein [Myxococcota bacterium]|nr:mitochondrial fission ELM1 family protein [Myxococcota bacterium]
MSESNPRQSDRDGGRPPRVWLLIGHKPGDNAQVRELARAVGWPCEEKSVVVRPEWETAKPRIRPSLDHIDLARSDALASPWPELVIASGRRLACVALWLKRASGGRTRIVMVGLPRHRRGQFDLLVVASHYVVAPAQNVAKHDLPLLRIDAAAIARAADDWRPRFEALARPITALMLGGPTGGLRFDLDAMRVLLAAARADAARSGGALFVTTSRRTPTAVVEWLRGACAEGEVLHVFDAAAPSGTNPYHALLGQADHFIVTTDSLSMMVEVARLGKSLAIFPLDNEVGPLERALERAGLLRPLDPRRDPIPGGGFLARALFRLGLPVHTRDLSAIPRRLVERGLACWLGDARVVPGAGAGEEVERVALRVRALVADGAGHAAAPS